ncbi:MAG: metal-sensitive transcriptional regulator [Candidatus Pacebacteria bacterium]|nr:metal-sensitive transcriptional regulator [Candidatus Paceibacterota bacterium]
MEKGKHYKAELEKMLHRISRIEGQVRGIRKMIEENRNCRDVVTQVAAAKEALAGLGAEVLRNELVRRQKEKKKVDEKYLRSLFKF